ncbi:predicted protein [Sclerotinia sclerotiorum 1980 UF-70]|uniref:Uncharacterized protein n=1 Tax=Sclerotinia sclerotiorum (strain ATCC 18683 / 1980 / Ss-1) TaxID=665079 RepID=A7EIM9_SCLS1|nr:predicted protein [Sclerotinia sclerotiorum 1980 UF-70]EDO02695.1 predicted protein [Sclerotinia sclerotiorum 1980 UF-70]
MYGHPWPIRGLSRLLLSVVAGMLQEVTSRNA